MPYSRLGASPDCNDPLVAVSNADCYEGASGGGIDWTQVIDTAVTTAGQVLTHGAIPTYPSYPRTTLPVVSSPSSLLLPALLVGGLLLAMSSRR